MIQDTLNTPNMQEYALPVSVIFVFFLLIHQRHRFIPTRATLADIQDGGSRRAVRPSGRIQRVVSAAAAAAAEVDEQGVDDTTGSSDSDGALEYPPSSSDSISSNASPARASSLRSIPEQRIEDAGVYGTTCRCASDENARTVLGSHAGLSRTSTEGRHSLRPTRSASASSTAVQGIKPGSSVFRANPGAQSSNKASRMVAEPATSLSVEFSLLKVEEEDDDDLLNQPVPISTPLPPRRATTPRTPTKARGVHAFTPDFDDAPSSDAAPLSSPLPPRQAVSAASRGLSSASTRTRASAPARSRTATPSSASTLRAPSRTVMSHATPPPSSVGSSASATITRASSEAPDLWMPLSRMSSLSPTPSEVTEQWVHKISTRTLPSADDLEDDAERVVITAWFESSSEQLIDSPPNLRGHPDLQLGDLFYHSTTGDYQLWIWEHNADGVPCWTRVKFMSQRNGMYLTLTPGERRPSWVGEKYAHTRKRELLRMGYEV